VIRCALLSGTPLLDPASVLTGSEAGLLTPRAVPKRRNDFLRGRWIAKKLMSRVVPGLGPLDTSILPDDRGVPLPFGNDGPLPFSLSITHTDGIAGAAMVELPDLVGIDAERLIRDPSLIAEDYFTAIERGHLGDPQTSSRVATVIWASKEAVSKALGEGLRLSLTSMVVLDPGPLELGVWHPVRVRVDGHPSLSLWTWHEESAVVAVAAVPEDHAAPTWELRI